MNVKELREKYYKKQGNKCKILKKDIDEKVRVLDHIHTSHKSLYPNSFGNCRGTIHRDVNILIGKIENQYLRFNVDLKKEIKLPDLLREIANYLEDDYSENDIHPKEIKKDILMKSDYNKLKKLFLEKYPNKKFKEYPSSKRKLKFFKDIADELNFKFK